MTMNAIPAFPGAMGSACVQMANADGTNNKTILTGSNSGSYPNGSTVGRITTATDDVANTLTISRQIGATTCRVATISIPANAGTSASVSPVDVLAQAFQGVPINLAPGEVLLFKAGTAITGGKFIEVHVEYGSY